MTCFVALWSHCLSISHVLCCTLPLQVDLPLGVRPRCDHTATVISSGRGSALVLVHGGLRELGGAAISAPAVIHLGRLQLKNCNKSLLVC